MSDSEIGEEIFEGPPGSGAARWKKRDKRYALTKTDREFPEEQKKLPMEPENVER